MACFSRFFFTLTVQVSLFTVQFQLGHFNWFFIQHQPVARRCRACVVVHWGVGASSGPQLCVIKLLALLNIVIGSLTSSALSWTPVENLLWTFSDCHFVADFCVIGPVVLVKWIPLRWHQHTEVGVSCLSLTSEVRTTWPVLNSLWILEVLRQVWTTES